MNYGEIWKGKIHKSTSKDRRYDLLYTRFFNCLILFFNWSSVGHKGNERLLISCLFEFRNFQCRLIFDKIYNKINNGSFFLVAFCYHVLIYAFTICIFIWRIRIFLQIILLFCKRLLKRSFHIKLSPIRIN